MPGVSIIKVFSEILINEVVTVVCFPLSVKVLIFPTSKFKKGKRVFNKEDFPTPDCPQNKLFFPSIRFLNRSIPSLFIMLVLNMEYPIFS